MRRSIWTLGAMSRCAGWLVHFSYNLLLSPQGTKSSYRTSLQLSSRPRHRARTAEMKSPRDTLVLDRKEGPCLTTALAKDGRDRQSSADRQAVEIIPVPASCRPSIIGLSMCPGMLVLPSLNE